MGPEALRPTQGGRYCTTWIPGGKRVSAQGGKSRAEAGGEKGKGPHSSSKKGAPWDLRNVRQKAPRLKEIDLHWKKAHREHVAMDNTSLSMGGKGTGQKKQPRFSKKNLFRAKAGKVFPPRNKKFSTGGKERCRCERKLLVSSKERKEDTKKKKVCPLAKKKRNPLLLQNALNGIFLEGVRVQARENELPSLGGEGTATPTEGMYRREGGRMGSVKKGALCFRRGGESALRRNHSSCLSSKNSEKKKEEGAGQDCEFRGEI